MFQNLWVCLNAGSAKKAENRQQNCERESTTAFTEYPLQLARNSISFQKCAVNMKCYYELHTQQGSW